MYAASETTEALPNIIVDVLLRLNLPLSALQSHDFCKMADMSTNRPLRLNSMLCFVMSRYNKLDLKYIRDITIGFYNADKVNAAKKQLLIDAKDKKLDSLLSRYPEPQGDGRVSREVDDILSIVQQLDESTSVQYLPCYVTDNMDKVPSIKLDDGDMRLMINKLSTMEAMVQSLQSIVCSLSAAMNAGNHSGNSRNDVTQWPSLPQRSNVSTPTQCHQHRGIPPSDSDRPRSTVDTYNGSKNGRTDDERSSVKTATSAISWAQSSDNGIPNDDGDTDVTDADGFTLYESQRDKRLRRGSPSAGTVENNVENNVVTHSVEHERPPTSSTRKPLMVGRRSTAAFTTRDAAKLTAAKPQKLVVCVDNVAPNLSETDLTEFVSSLGVRVLTCFKVKPRLPVRLRVRTITVNHSTFRLCINKADQHLLLNSEVWPEDIVIKRYFFKNAGQTNSATGGPTVDAADSDAVLTDPTDSTLTVDNTAMAGGDGDNTEIYMDQGQPAASTPLRC